MKITFYLSISIFFITLLPFPINAAEKSILIVCTEWPGYTNPDGTGIYWDLVKAVYDPLGFKVHTKIVPWKRAELMVENKHADALIGDYYYPQKDGKERLYPKWHLSVEDPLSAIFKKGLHKIESFNSMNGKSIIWMRGYDFDKIFLKDIPHKMHEIDSTEKGLNLIMHDRYDVFLDYHANIKNVSKKIDIDFSLLETVIIKLGSKLYLNFSNTENSKKLIGFYDKRIPELLKSGELEKVFTKYNSNMSKFGPDRYNSSK